MQFPTELSDGNQFWDYESPLWAGKFLDEWAGKPCAHESGP
jgi:hypothetical protein